jgi:hypothetical protein
MRDEIFDEFLKNLEKKNLPPKLINELKNLWLSNHLRSKDDILNVIKETVEIDNNQEN